ncbi:hypothetical protein P8C59_006251 [Phyllachora maydis]|uniref:Reverse transcriptase Ty1/copia-type domain-containing protein n=1 Tax=Phyllachora maydis TaxID=1825666 RepID=A0AAD9I6D3_9PEZI|nr:hypothetical protein P8C59_006251 [Phyllachora maydis]
MQLDYYKLLAKTSSYILSFVYKARKRIISKDSTPTTYKQVLKLPRDERSKWLEAITKESIYALREEIYMEIPKGLLDLAASNKAIYKLLLKYGYNPFTPNIIELSKALYGVFYNAKTCHFIVTYVDDCLFIGPNIGYITDLKKRLNKVYAIEDLGPAAYFLGVQIIRDRPNRRLWLNQLQDFHSKEGPRPLTTTSTTIVDSRNSKGSSRTSIINSSLVPVGFSDSDFAGDKATSKSTYGYLYKLAEAICEVQWIIGLFSELHRPIDYPITLYGDNQGSITVANDPALYARTKYTLLKFRYVRE